MKSAVSQAAFCSFSIQPSHNLNCLTASHIECMRDLFQSSFAESIERLHAETEWRNEVSRAWQRLACWCEDKRMEDRKKTAKQENTRNTQSRADGEITPKQQRSTKSKPQRKTQSNPKSNNGTQDIKKQVSCCSIDRSRRFCIVYLGEQLQFHEQHRHPLHQQALEQIPGQSENRKCEKEFKKKEIQFGKQTATQSITECHNDNRRECNQLHTDKEYKQ